MKRWIKASELMNRAMVAPRLGPWDAVSLIVGIVVGTSIYRGTATIFEHAGGPWIAIALWLLGGALAWCGAVCYAELATTYPRDGGDYEYLNRAFGSWCGFLFAWSQITIIISGNIAIMAYAFADYAANVWTVNPELQIWLTIAPVVALSALNACGIIAGKVTQNVLTLTKLVGLTALIAAGALAMYSRSSAPQNIAPGSSARSDTSVGLALVFVLYTYGGWAHAAYVAAEVRDQQRNLPRALMLGIVGVTIIYLAVNTAYLAALGFERARSSTTPAADTLDAVAGRWGHQAISILVMISALGAINGMILTGTRIYATWGADYPALRWLAAWNRRTAAPVSAIALQTLIAMALICLVGTNIGRAFFDAPLRYFGNRGLPWGNFRGGFELLVAGSAPVYWALCLMTGIAVFVLRIIDRHAERPFRIPLFPVPAIAFCATCVFMLYSSQVYARWVSLIGIVPLAVGAVVWGILHVRRSG